MVSLLRGTKSATADDVKLYLKDYNKLKYKFNKVNAAEIPLEVVEHHESLLSELTSYFKDEKAADYQINCQYIHLLAWS